MSFTYGSGTELDPYQVWTATDLDNVRNYTTSYFIQMADIDLVSYANWVPIGNSSRRFSGNYDGYNFTISNLTIVNRDYYGGLFAQLYGAVIVKNIKLSNVNISGGVEIGGVAGEGYGWSGSIPLIENCHVLSGQISGVVVGTRQGDYIAGIVGYTSYTDIKGCSSNCTISGRQHIAGVVGYHTGGDIEECFSLSSVTATFWNAGGLIGAFGEGNIRNCYARGSVHSANRAGGILGGDSADELCDIENCYFAGTVSADAGSVGGFAGYSSETSIRSNCYYDSDTTGLSGDNYGASPRTTAEMTSPYSDPDNIYIDWVFYDDENYVWVHDKDTYEYDITRIITDSDFIIDTCTVYGADRAFCEYRYLASIFYQSVSYDGVTMIFGENDVTSYIKVVGGVTYLPVRVIAQDLYNLRVIWSELNYQVLLFGCVDGTINDGYPHFIKPSKLIHRILIPITGGTIVYL